MGDDPTEPTCAEMAVEKKAAAQNQDRTLGSTTRGALEDPRFKDLSEERPVAVGKQTGAHNGSQLPKSGQNSGGKPQKCP